MKKLLLAVSLLTLPFAFANAADNQTVTKDNFSNANKVSDIYPPKGTPAHSDKTKTPSLHEVPTNKN